MQRMILIFAFLAAASTVHAQEVSTEATAAPNDSKSGGGTWGYTIEGKFQRVLVLRLKYQTDLMAGLEGAVKENKIRNAVIISGIGSVRNYQFHVVSNRTFPTENAFVKGSTAPADLVSMNGYVVDGRVHAHICLSNADKAFGGHLETGTNVFTFAIITIGVLSDSTDLRHIDDKGYQ